MTYKHENDVIYAVDFMKPSYAERKHKAIQVEVDEVYRKAEAYDGKSVKPIEAGMDSVYVRFHECPKCGGADIIYEFNFCPDCGVKLDWSGVE